jgi:hypothetical protein
MLRYTSFKTSPVSKFVKSGFKTSLAAVLALAIPLLALFLLFAGVTSAQGKTYTIPFHSIHDRILLDVQVDHKPAVLLLDTGSNVTFSMQPEHMLAAKTKDGKVSFVTTSEVPNANFFTLEMHIDGVVGQDFLRTFSRVIIDFKAKVLELEQ